MKKQIMLSDGEYEIMNCVWTLPEAPTQTGILRWVNEQNGKSLKVATIATYIRRIIWKGYLEKVDIGDGHPKYRALISKDEYFERVSSEFRDKWDFSYFIKMAVGYLSDLSASEKQEFIDQVQKGGPNGSNT